MPEKPEQKARREIDADLAAAGWLVQDRDDLDLTAGRGIAVREFSMKPRFGSADYLLYLDRQAIGAVEAKPSGTLTGVEAQSAKYAAGLPDNLPAHRRPLPFLFESNGSVTYFTNGLDPTPRSRQAFNFPRPETLVEWITQPAQIRARLHDLPPLDETRLWKVQAKAIRNLEESFRRADPRALIQMATGSGKTFAAVNVAYLLLKFAMRRGFSSSSTAATSVSRRRTSLLTSSRRMIPASFRRSTLSNGLRRTRSIRPPRL
jgi:type I restriction enzyme R subunit